MSAASKAGVTLSSVGKFSGDTIRMGQTEASLAELSALYRGRFGEIFG